VAADALTSKRAEGELAVEAVAEMRRSSGALLNTDLDVAAAWAAARGCSGKALGAAASLVENRSFVQHPGEF
jgi:head-tail adaptor